MTNFLSFKFEHLPLIFCPNLCKRFHSIFLIPHSPTAHTNFSFLMAFYMSFHNSFMFDASKRKEMTNNEKKNENGPEKWKSVSDSQSWHHFFVGSITTLHMWKRLLLWTLETRFWLAANMMRKWIILLLLLLSVFHVFCLMLVFSLTLRWENFFVVGKLQMEKRWGNSLSLRT